MKLMILDPQNDPRFIEYININIIKGTPIYNFYSLLDCGIYLNNLRPVDELKILLRDSIFGDSETLEFDKAYANQLIANPYSFMDLELLLGSVTNNESTILLSNYNNRVIMPILDSLLKLIQERYGLDYFIYNIVEDIDDTEYSQFSDNIKQQVLLADQERAYVLFQQHKRQFPMDYNIRAEIEEDFRILSEGY